MQRYALKLVLIGDSRVGKSQLSRAFVNKHFMDDAQVTVGIEFATKVIEFEKSLIQTHIWDTAGQERIQGMTKAFYRNTAGALLVFDVCNRKSFENLRTMWVKQLRDQGYTDVRLILVGNKVDLLEKGHEREVSVEEATEFARQENMDYMETSALTNYYVDHMFRRISLAVARALPEVAIHLEVSDLPEGWMACNEATCGADSAANSAISVSDVSAALMDGADSSTKMAPPSAKSSPSAKTKSPMASEAALGMKVTYVNYWTGESTTEKPTGPADTSPGLLYAARDAVEIDALTGKPKDLFMQRTSSCKTTATFVSSSSAGSGSRNNSRDQGDSNDCLSESRRTMSRSRSGQSEDKDRVRRCFQCVCSIS